MQSCEFFQSLLPREMTLKKTMNVSQKTMSGFNLMVFMIEKKVVRAEHVIGEEGDEEEDVMCEQM